MIEHAKEIDPSWTQEAIDASRHEFFETDHGFIKMRPLENMILLDLLWVQPQDRGQGWGRDLLRIAENTARIMKLQGVGTYTEVPAFFTHNGYEQVGEVDFEGHHLHAMFKEIPNVSYSQEALI